MLKQIIFQKLDFLRESGSIKVCRPTGQRFVSVTSKLHLFCISNKFLEVSVSRRETSSEFEIQVTIFGQKIILNRIIIWKVNGKVLGYNWSRKVNLIFATRSDNFSILFSWFPDNFKISKLEVNINIVNMSNYNESTNVYVDWNFYEWIKFKFVSDALYFTSIFYYVHFFTFLYNFKFFINMWKCI